MQDSENRKNENDKFKKEDDLEEEDI